MFAKVSGGTVVGIVNDLPQSFGNVTGFANADQATQLAAGFFQIVDDRPVFNAAYQRLTGPEYTVGATTVTATYSIWTMPFADYQAENVARLKFKAAALLAPTDWLVVRLAETATAIPQAILDERAAIRAESNTQGDAVVAATDHQAVASIMNPT